MTILGRYILLEYAKFFLVCLLSLVFIAIVFAAIPEIDNLEKVNGATLFFDSIFSGIPLLIEIITPISVLLATILTFLSLKRTSEIVAMSAAGVSQARMVLPIILFGFVICFFTYLNQSYLAPYWGADERTSVVKQNLSDSNWRFYKGKLYYFSGIALKSKELKSNTIFHFERDFQLTQIAHNHQLKLTQTGWHTNKNSEFLILTDLHLTHHKSSFIPISEDQFPVIFKKELPYPKYNSFDALLSEIKVKDEGGVNFESDLFAFYQKIAALFAIFIMTFLALPFSLYSHKESKIRAGIVTAVILGLVYFLVDQVFLSMSQSAAVSIELSAFGANIVFFILALYLIRLKRA